MIPPLLHTRVTRVWYVVRSWRIATPFDRAVPVPSSSSIAARKSSRQPLWRTWDPSSSVPQTETAVAVAIAAACLTWKHLNSDTACDHWFNDQHIEVYKRFSEDRNKCKNRRTDKVNDPISQRSHNHRIIYSLMELTAKFVDIAEMLVYTGTHFAFYYFYICILVSPCLGLSLRCSGFCEEVGLRWLVWSVKARIYVRVVRSAYFVYQYSPKATCATKG